MSSIKVKKPPCERYGKAYINYTRLGKQYCRKKPYYDNNIQPSMKNIHNTMKEIKKSINELKILNIKVNKYVNRPVKLPPPTPPPPKQTLVRKSTSTVKSKPKINIQAAMMNELQKKLAKRNKI